MTTRRLVMLRHGQTDFNLGSRMQGQLDTELTELGRAQAVAAAEALAKHQPLLIVSSDLRRAYDTAVALGERTGLRVRVDDRLRETHLGDWQGMTHGEIDAVEAEPATGVNAVGYHWGTPGSPQSVSTDGRQAVMFAFLHSSSMLNPYPRIHLQGLDPKGRYRLRVLAGKTGEDTPEEASGAHWMSEGIQLMLKGDFQAAAVVLDRVAQ